MIHTNETVNATVGKDEQAFIRLTYDSNQGLTIKMNITNGTVKMYVSDQITTPNEAFYDWMAETSECLDIYLDPNELNRTAGVSVHVVIQGIDISNEFIFIAENDNTGKFCVMLM